jgi:hypothetical protein
LIEKRNVSLPVIILIDRPEKIIFFYPEEAGYLLQPRNRFWAVKQEDFKKIK